LRAGDRLALAGTRDAIAGARALLGAQSGDAHSMIDVLAGALTPLPRR
jgi:hypothetical protein